MDDGSTDATREVLAGEQVLALPTNAGKGEAVRRGLIEAIGRGARATGYWDADLSTPPEEILRLREALVGERRLVMGARVLLYGRDIRRRAIRHYPGRVFATAAAMTLGAPFYDTQCGAKLLVADAKMGQLLARPFASRWAFDAELIGRVLRQDGAASVEEVPLGSWTESPASKVRPSDAPRGLMDLARIAWRLRTTS